MRWEVIWWGFVRELRRLRKEMPDSSLNEKFKSSHGDLEVFLKVLRSNWQCDEWFQVKIMQVEEKSKFELQIQFGWKFKVRIPPDCASLQQCWLFRDVHDAQSSISISTLQFYCKTPARFSPPSHDITYISTFRWWWKNRAKNFCDVKLFPVSWCWYSLDGRSRSSRCFSFICI